MKEGDDIALYSTAGGVLFHGLTSAILASMRAGASAFAKLNWTGVADSVPEITFHSLMRPINSVPLSRTPCH